MQLPGLQRARLRTRLGRPLRRGGRPAVASPETAARLTRALLALGLILALGGCRASARPCRSDSPCGRRDYCSYPGGRCGQGATAGLCRPRPTSCTQQRAPVCGCDGRVHGNDCLAQAAGVDLAVFGGCRAMVPDWIACGARYCDARTSYCEIYLSDVPELPTDYACRPLPPACLPSGGSPRGCECFPRATPCLSFCGPMPTGGRQGFHLTCQGVKPPPARERR
jgi:hypothetical protein